MRWDLISTKRWEHPPHPRSAMHNWGSPPPPRGGPYRKCSTGLTMPHHLQAGPFIHSVQSNWHVTRDRASETTKAACFQSPCHHSSPMISSEQSPTFLMLTAFSNFLPKKSCCIYAWNIWKPWAMPNSAYYCNSKQVLDKKSAPKHYWNFLHKSTQVTSLHRVVTTGALGGFFSVLQGLKVKLWSPEGRVWAMACWRLKRTDALFFLSKSLF